MEQESLIDTAVELDADTLEGLPEEISVQIEDETGELGALAEEEVEEEDEEDDGHYANLALKMTESQLGIISSELLQHFENDLDSRKPWDLRFKRGMYLLGFIDDPGRTKPFASASEATHPVLAEAMVQFNSRAITELFPPGGPVKGKVVGKSTRATDEQRDRVETHMNYQYVEEMPEAFSEMDKLTFRCAYEGSSFKKTFYDPLVGRMRSIYVSGRNIIIPYEAQSVETSPRVSHHYRISHNELLRRQHNGQWRLVEVSEPSPSSGERSEADEAVAKSEDRTDTGMGDGEHEVVEMQVFYDLPGYEDQKDGKPTGIGLPYLVTMLKDEDIVLSIRRDWDVADLKRNREMSLTHYGFVPGFGVYYLGLIHLIGGLAEASTGTVRALLDSAQFAAAQGGFKSKEARAAKGEVALEPGKYKDVDLSADELAKAFYTPPYKEPPVVLFQLLGALTDYARRFASTTEAMVGEANNNGPVGTTLAIIEQGMKVFSAIHKRMHAAQMQEFRILAKLNYRHLPETAMPVHWNGSTMEVMKSDYDGRVDVIPVSDPNLFSQTQRIALAQGINQLAKADPTGSRFDQREADLIMLRAMGVSNEQIERVMPDPNRNMVQLDAVTENQMFLMGKPVRVYADQAHPEHITIHKSFGQALPPELQQRVEGAMTAHIAWHYAEQYRVEMESAITAKHGPGVDLQTPNYAASGGEPMVRPVDPDLDRLIAMDVAAMMAQQAPPQPQETPEMIAERAEQARLDRAAEAEEKRKDRAAAREIARRDEKFKQELEIADGEAAAKALREPPPKPATPGAK